MEDKIVITLTREEVAILNNVLQFLSANCPTGSVRMSSMVIVE